jgi:hypothetical protein
MKRGGIVPEKNIMQYEAMPDKESTLEGTCRVVISGEKIRYSNKFPAWMRKKKSFVPHEETDVFDNGVYTNFTSAGAIRGVPWAMIRPLERPRQANNVDLFPLLLNLRPTNKVLGPLHQEKLQVASEGVLIGGRPAVILSPVPEGNLPQASPPTIAYWVEPTKRYRVARYEVKQGDKTFTQITINFDEQSDRHWVPESWTAVVNNADGSLMHWDEIRVTECRLNESVAANEFKIDFPVGTFVEDFGKGTNYFVKEGGSARPVSEAELREYKDPAVLLQAIEGGSSWRPIVIMAVVVGLVLGGGAIIFAWWRARARRAGA